MAVLRGILWFFLIPARVLRLIEDSARKRAARDYDYHVNRLGWDPECYADDRRRVLHPSSSHPLARPHMHVPHGHAHLR